MGRGCLLVFALLAQVAWCDLPKAFRTTVEYPASITTNAAGGVLVDFGRDAYGWLEFDSPVAGGYHLAIGEIVRDGSVWAPPIKSNIRYRRLQGRTTPGVFRVPMPADERNTDAKFGPLGVPPELGVVMPFRAVELAYGPFASVTYTNVRRVTVAYGYDLGESSFRCSDERLNRLWAYLKNCVAASTAFGLFVDGDRERLPYEGDAFGTQLASYAAFSDTEIVRATFEHLMDHPTWPTEGKFCMVFMAWHDWRRTGRTDLVAKWYDRLVAEKLYGEKPRADGLLVTDVTRDNPDWPRCERDGYDLRPVNAEVNAYYFQALGLMSELAAALGKHADAAAFAARAAKVRAAFDATFVDPSTGLVLDGEGSSHSSLHANALALAFGLVPEERRARTADFVVSRGRACSPYFMLYVLEALRVCGREREIYDALLADDDRSWLGMLDFGATMGMEAWNLKVKPNLDVNHSWVAVPLHFFATWILGVNVTEPGGKDFSVTPHLGPLEWAEGVVPTSAGRIRVRAERLGGDVSAFAAVDSQPLAERASKGRFCVLDFGARGDGVTKDTAAVQRAIDAASAAGGGEVRLPRGVYLCGSVFLKSRVDFHLEEGAVLKGSPDAADYNALDVAPQNWGRLGSGDNISGGHLLLCIEQENVTLRGPGKIDGNVGAFLKMPDGSHPPTKLEIPWRPAQMVWFVESRNIAIRDIEIADAPYWSCFVYGCEDVVVENANIHTVRTPHTYNGDGLDIDSSRRVRVAGCRISTSDDAITLRAAGQGRLKCDGPCADVTVSNCTLSSDCNAIRLGVGNGLIRDCSFADIRIENTRFAVNAVGAWSRIGRGVDISRISFENMEIDAKSFCKFYYKVATHSVFDGISFRHVRGKVREPSSFEDTPERPFRNLRFDDVWIEGETSPRVRNMATNQTGGQK